MDDNPAAIIAAGVALSIYMGGVDAGVAVRAVARVTGAGTRLRERLRVAAHHIKGSRTRRLPTGQCRRRIPVTGSNPAPVR